MHELTDDEALLLRVDHAIAYALGHTTRQRSARLALVAVLERSWEREVLRGWSTLTSLAALALRTGEGTESVVEWQAGWSRWTSPCPRRSARCKAAARACVRSVGGGPSGRTPELVEQARGAPALGADAPADLVFGTEMLLGTVAWLVDEHDAAQSRLARAAELMLRTDAPGELPQTLLALGQVRFEMGRWEEAEETARLLADSPRLAASSSWATVPPSWGADSGGPRRRDPGSEIVQATEAAVDPGGVGVADVRPDPDQGPDGAERRRPRARVRAPQVPLPRRRHRAALANVRARPRRPRGWPRPGPGGPARWSR